LLEHWTCDQQVTGSVLTLYMSSFASGKPLKCVLSPSSVMWYCSWKINKIPQPSTRLCLAEGWGIWDRRRPCRAVTLQCHLLTNIQI